MERAGMWLHPWVCAASRDFWLLIGSDGDVGLGWCRSPQGPSSGHVGLRPIRWDEPGYFGKRMHHWLGQPKPQVREVPESEPA